MKNLAQWSGASMLAGSALILAAFAVNLEPRGMADLVIGIALAAPLVGWGALTLLRGNHLERLKAMRVPGDLPEDARSIRQALDAALGEHCQVGWRFHLGALQIWVTEGRVFRAFAVLSTMIGGILTIALVHGFGNVVAMKHPAHALFYTLMTWAIAGLCWHFGQESDERQLLGRTTHKA